MSALDTLRRLFVHGYDGRVVLCDNVTTPHITLSSLHTLERRGLVTAEEAENYRRVLGVRAWTLRLTDAGKAALQVFLQNTPSKPDTSTPPTGRHGGASSADKGNPT
jgi:hypothetical protein